MSKTENKLVNGVCCVMAAMQRASVLSAALDVTKFRDTFKLTSMGRKRIVSAIDDILSTNLIVDQFGPWVLAEIEHPNYQLSAATGNTVVLFHKEGEPNPGAEVVAGYGTKTDAGDDDTEDDAANEKALDADAAMVKAEAADKTREFEPGEKEEKALKEAFQPEELEILKKLGLLKRSDAHSIEYLREALKGKTLAKETRVDAKKPAPKAKAAPKKVKPAPKAKAAPKKVKSAPKAKKARK